ncbi:MAG: VOC family protein [Bacteroidia bacterium]|nr:VOC family protein [Bacteroidia bacterium]NNF31117.1 glyoxalase [Flavobacteriaceae bacterium]NNJ81517.1 glyoxalase [Flavobacteriaceae bacterium]NNK55579.1 glyoxalase [Flavobacteriaceae bacterium]NNM08869.1 glyoxalase [Flavobacteriaceae bacterium]
MKPNLRPFHLAIPVNEIPKNRAFYRDVLGCKEGRSSDHWVDFDFFGHQLVIHLKEEWNDGVHSNPVDGKDVPVPHFGVVLDMSSFEQLSGSLEKQNIKFIIEPYIRFEGEVGEQATMFFKDPSGNALEFKAFKNIDQLFAK